jgi:Fe-S oxidoreductase
MAYINELVKDCLQNERAFCTAVCPFNLDVCDLIGKLQQGRFNVAYKTYQNTVGFPGIVSALCPEPCKHVCVLKDSGSISIKMLEKASMEFARSLDPDQYNMPPKDKRIAIIGGGISGLACALRLATRKYAVTVYEKSDRYGGHLNELPDRDYLIADIGRQFTHETYTLLDRTEVMDLSDIDADAIYVATGSGGNDFGLLRDSGGAFASYCEGVFLGGSLTGADTMQAIAQGLSASNAIERFLKIGKMNQPDEIRGTRLKPESIRIKKSEPIEPLNGISFTKEEALAEAKRCLKCTCDACVHYSPLMNYFEKYPKRITEEVEVTINPCTLDGNGTVATRLIATCHHCGLCKEVCPQDIDTGEFLLKSHRAMREKGAMPWAFHEFYLRDMEFANSEASLVKAPIGYQKSSYMFFPGCQLGASDPQYVSKSYQLLTEQYPDTALILGCCGAPAEWAGDEPLHSQVIDEIRQNWIRLGKPTAIFACPTCKQMFGKYLPEIESRFLYPLIEESGVAPVGLFQGITASVFDPCASRHETDLQQTIRKLAAKAGFLLEPLPMEGKRAECCSYGGQVAIAYPPYASHTVQNRISQNNHPYITYCSNCRDIFAKAGKPAWHILDLMFGIERESASEPTVSERRLNRLQLKDQLLKEFWLEDGVMEKSEIQLLISQELKEKMDKGYILETDAREVIESSEKSGRKLFNPGKDSFTGHLQIGHTTYWVEYQVKNENRFELLNAYSHRMKIEE